MKALLLLLHLPLCALYMGNPAAPELTEYGLFSPKESSWGIEMSYQGNFSYDRPMKLIEQSIANERVRLDNFSYESDLGVISLNIADRAQLFAGFGALEVDFSRRPFPGTRTTYLSQNDFVWTVGGQAVLFFIEDFTFGVSANYLTTSPNVKSITENGAVMPTFGSELHYSEWQVGIGGSGRFGIFVPYIGAAFASANLSVKGPRDMSAFVLQVRDETYKSYDKVSLVLGLGLSNESLVCANIEARLVGETAGTFSLTFRF